MDESLDERNVEHPGTTRNVSHDESPKFGNVYVTYENLPPTPPKVFGDLAVQVQQQSGVSLDLSRLAQVLQRIAQSCKEGTVRFALVRAGDHPHGIAAMVVRNKISSVLPDDLKLPAVINTLVQVGAAAAKDDNIWSLVYPKA